MFLHTVGHPTENIFSHCTVETVFHAIPPYIRRAPIQGQPLLDAWWLRRLTSRKRRQVNCSSQEERCYWKGLELGWLQVIPSSFFQPQFFTISQQLVFKRCCSSCMKYFMNIFHNQGSFLFLSKGINVEKLRSVHKVQYRYQKGRIFCKHKCMVTAICAELPQDLQHGFNLQVCLFSRKAF